jgi:sigma-B regulation protein RsbU (phosphoserine phosphatase)
VIADASQRALLRAMPSAIGPVGFAARYVSASEDAAVGGDLYEVAATPYGVRVIVGDVRGKGLEAVQTAASVLGAFRQAAFQEPDLAALARSLDHIVTRVIGEEEFVTALLAQFQGDTVTLVNCGHHPPLLVHRAPSLLDTGEPQPPLGLAPEPVITSHDWPSSARLLLYTDGLVEARDARREFFPLSDVAPDLARGTLDEALDQLLARLHEFAGRRIGDDIALVLAENQFVAPRA